MKAILKSTGAKVTVTGKTGDLYRVYVFQNGNGAHHWVPKDDVEFDVPEVK